MIKKLLLIVALSSSFSVFAALSCKDFNQPMTWHGTLRSFNAAHEVIEIKVISLTQEEQFNKIILTYQLGKRKNVLKLSGDCYASNGAITSEAVSKKKMASGVLFLRYTDKKKQLSIGTGMLPLNAHIEDVKQTVGSVTGVLQYKPPKKSS